ncbi:MAG: hypothetical protein U5K00_21820 [Melioribacteraceae bacterium]|nr:hypothetical protein [Melioribacteraceae bacterium]
MIQKTKYLLIFAILLLVACSSEEKLNKEKPVETDNEASYSTELNIKFHKVYSWVNLMPGPKAKPRFHITGEYELFESPDYKIDEIKLGHINILQNDSLIYNITPEVRINEKLSTDSTKYVIFSNPTELPAHPLLDRKKSVDAEFIFYSVSDTMQHSINDITIEEAH